MDIFLSRAVSMPQKGAFSKILRKMTNWFINPAIFLAKDLMMAKTIFPNKSTQIQNRRRKLPSGILL